MALSASISKVRSQHNAILDFLIAHPTMKKGDVAALFGVTPGWLSVIINSDAFQMRLRERQDEVFSDVVVPLAGRVLEAAETGVEKLHDALKNSSPVTDKDFIASTTDSLLKNLGYSPNRAGPAPSQQAGTINNFISVNKSSLAQARDTMRTINAPQGELEELSDVGGE